MRIDVVLVEKGLASSRNRAQELIDSGRVYYVSEGTRRTVTKPSLKLDKKLVSTLGVVPEANEYVSRGGLKLKGALERTKFDVHGLTALDVGISTGGFTDCLLREGARKVVGIDVGHGQLAKQLASDPRVSLVEGVNARDLSNVKLIELNEGSKFDLAVVDVSFISLTLVLHEVIQYLKETAPVIALVKPQFEVGREGLGKNGIVKDAALYPAVEEKIRRACRAEGLAVEDYFESSIEGSDGNREFFVFARHPQLHFGHESTHRV